MTRHEAGRELVLQREVPFARELVWKAMTEPEHQNRWWGPDGFRNEGVTMDFRVGGAWTFDMVGPDGKRVWFETTITLEATGIGTLITLRHLFPDRESRDEVVNKYGALEGGKQHLAKLEAYLRGNPPAGTPEPAG
jgi:uncharacterized protein YndB with AHSA1/START domain